jgi:hypothetical protein
MNREIEKPSEKLLAALGTMCDFKVAATFGVRPFQVKLLREQQGIPSVSSTVDKHHYDWTAAAERLLGTMPDTVLAKQLNTTRAIIDGRRRVLGVLAFERPIVDIQLLVPQKTHDWTLEEEALLGTDYDNVLADQLGINSTQVTYHRNKLGVDPFRRGTRIEWTQQMLDNLGEIPDGEFAEYFGICKTSVYIKRILLSIPAFNSVDLPSPPRIPRESVKFLGKIYDVDLAVEFSVNRLNIRVNRLIRGIAPLERGPNEKHFKWTPEMDSLLGVLPDTEVSRELKIGSQVVRYRRRKLGIAPAMRDRPLVWDDLMLSELGRNKDQILSQIWRCDVKQIIEKREALGLAEHNGPRVWLESEIALLGVMADPVLSQKLRLSATAVRNKRVALGIKPKYNSKKRRWSKKYLVMLGTMSDEKVAYAMKVTTNMVTKKRLLLNIAAFYSPHKGTWSDGSAISKLGTMSDPDLGRQLGITGGAVGIKRRAMGIPAFVAID